MTPCRTTPGPDGIVSFGSRRSIRATARLLGPFFGLLFLLLHAASCTCDAPQAGAPTGDEPGEERAALEPEDRLRGAEAAVEGESLDRGSSPRARKEVTAKPAERDSVSLGDELLRAEDGEEAAGAAMNLSSPTFQGEAEPLPKEVRSHMTGRSWREGCPVDLDDLALLTMSHWDMDGEVVAGEMVVSEEVADHVLKAFESLFDQGFPIAEMRRIDHWDGDDDRSMEANNSSAFNCRYVAGTKRWSEHSFGTAIDINPKQNPYVRGDLVAPPQGRAFLDRDDVRPGMLVPGPAVDAFKSIGWGWGGDWRSAKDYQHFSKSGR